MTFLGPVNRSDDGRGFVLVGPGFGMAIYHADNVALAADTDFGEGWLEFRWPDHLFGWECLTFDLNGYFCARRMPIRMGGGMPEFVEVQRDHIKMRFEPDLAAKLELEQEVEITYDLSDDNFRELCKIINYFQGE